MCRISPFQPSDFINFFLNFQTFKVVKFRLMALNTVKTIILDKEKLRIEYWWKFVSQLNYTARILITLIMHVWISYLKRRIHIIFPASGKCSLAHRIPLKYNHSPSFIASGEKFTIMIKFNTRNDIRFGNVIIKSPFNLGEAPLGFSITSYK